MRNRRWTAWILAAALLCGCAGQAPAKDTAEDEPAQAQAWEKIDTAETDAETVSEPAETSGEENTQERRASVSGPFGTVSLAVPEGWRCIACPMGDERLVSSCYALILYPEDAEENRIEVGCSQMFGVCGTGLEQEEISLAGDTAVAGTYDGHAMFDFISFKGKNECVTALRFGETWDEEKKEEAMQVLDTMCFDPEKRSGAVFTFTPSAEESRIGVGMELTGITAKGAVVRFYSYDADKAGELLCGKAFLLQKKNGDAWEDLPVLVENAAFTEEGYTIPKGDALELAQSWDWLYGELTLGTYRLEKSVWNSRAPGVSDEYRLSAEFVYEGEEGEAVSVDGAQPEESAVDAFPAPEPSPVSDLDPQAFVEGDGYYTWWSSYRETCMASGEVQAPMESFYGQVLSELLSGKEESAVCAPLNLYLALSTLAEVTDGRTRQQVLDFLGASSAEELRQRTNLLWDANAVDSPVLQSRPAASVWLKRGFPYRQETLEHLAEDCRVSAFAGEMGSEEMNRRLREWTDENTGHLLGEYTQGLHMEPETVLALVSAFYYKASWVDRFDTSLTDRQVFHGAHGDAETDMMHRTFFGDCYKGENFLAIFLRLEGEGSMVLVLPAEGKNPDDCLEDPGFLPLLLSGQGESFFAEISLSMPRFAVKERVDLLEALQHFGLTDCLDPATADFSPLTEEGGVFVGSAEHAAAVSADEEGVTGAAYTDLMLCGASMPVDYEKVDFRLDRPFVFAVVGGDQSLLFAGTVQDAE